MGNGCTSRFCKKAERMQTAAIAQNKLEIKAKDTPNGYCKLYPGVRTGNNEYTCPVLAVHTSRKTMENVQTEAGILHSMTTTSGVLMERSRTATLLTGASERLEYKVGVEENIQILPIEDIISVKVSTEVKKAVEQTKTAKLKAAPREELDCCQRLKLCCMKNVCCCCHTETQVAPEHEIVTTQKQNATRTIIITIEHLHNSLVDTPSNVRVLSKEKQEAFYQKYLNVETLKFYYLSNEVFDETQFKVHLQDSEILARIVMQLKAMVGHYPDEQELKKIIEQPHSRLFGEAEKENIAVLEGEGTSTTALVSYGTV